MQNSAQEVTLTQDQSGDPGAMKLERYPLRHLTDKTGQNLHFGRWLCVQIQSVDIESLSKTFNLHCLSHIALDEGIK